MSYQVLARKWRPRNFTEMVGQEHVQRTLINALDNDKLHHAFLFTGTRGVGKTTIARILAKSLNCEKGVSSTPCGECSPCREINAGHFVDLIEVDAASKTKVEDTRELLENVQYTPSQGRYKVYLIDEVHMLSGHSFNALLKTLEEPPPHVKFLFATTDPQKLPVTILSRCLQFILKRIEAEDPALLLLARAAVGSMRDALSLVDQGIDYGNGKLIEADVRSMLGTIDKSHVITLLEALQQNDANKLIQTTAHIEEQSFDFSNVLAEVSSLLHEIALAQIVPDALDNNIDFRDRVQALATQLEPEAVQLYYQIAITGRRDLPLAADLRSGFEMVLLRMLAFRPTDANSTERKQYSAPVSGTSIQTPVNTNNPAAAAKPATNQSEPASAAQGQVNSINPWHQMIDELNLSGITKQLANQCVLTQQTDVQIHLQLDSAHKQLLNDTQQQRLEKALQNYLAKPIKLLITTDAELPDETPAQIEKRKADARQQAAELSIENDSNVQSFIDTFDARVDSKSIRPK